MKKSIILLLAFIVISQTLVNVGIGIYYQLSKTYIIKKYCVNKNNPKLHCNGHCYLSKQLKKAEDKENKSVQLIKEQTEMISNENPIISLMYFPDFNITKLYPFDSYLYLSDYNPSVIKPPSV